MLYYQRCSIFVIDLLQTIANQDARCSIFATDFLLFSKHYSSQYIGKLMQLSEVHYYRQHYRENLHRNQLEDPQTVLEEGDHQEICNWISFFPLVMTLWAAFISTDMMKSGKRNSHLYMCCTPNTCKLCIWWYCFTHCLIPTHYHFFLWCSAMVSRLCSCKQLVLAFSTVFSCYLSFFSPLVLLLFFSCCCFWFGDHGALWCRAGIVVGSWLSMVFMMYCFHVTVLFWWSWSFLVMSSKTL